jgi:hypothetical protein
MAPDDPDEPLVTIAPVRPAVPEDGQRWIGPLIVIGLPVALASLVFVFLVLQ